MDFAVLLKEKILIGDGATGTELIRLGAPAGVPGDLLNLQKPEIVSQVHRGYAEAGSNMVITNTFGCTSIKLGKFKCADKMREINMAGVQIARNAVPPNVLIAGDIGPIGELLKPYGPAEPEMVKQAFAEQVEALVEGGVDLLILETNFDLNEAILALEAALDSGLPVIASMTFDLKRGGAYTMMGNSASDCAKTLSQAGATVVGANCSMTIDHMPAVAKELKKGADVPLILQPNAGKPEIVEGRTVYHETPENFAAKVPDLIAAGARIIGGCCGTDARFIRAIREAI